MITISKNIETANPIYELVTLIIVFVLMVSSNFLKTVYR